MINYHNILHLEYFTCQYYCTQNWLTIGCSESKDCEVTVLEGRSNLHLTVRINEELFTSNGPSKYPKLINSIESCLFY